MDKNKITIKEFKKKFNEMFSYAQKCHKKDCEVTLGGNGINCSEAMATLMPIKELVDKLED